MATLIKSLAALTLAISATASPTLRRQENSSAPWVTLRNGSYIGTCNPTYNTDYFLGIPCAQPPVGDLRFRHPQPLNSSWTGSRNATEYGPECIGYGRDTWSQGNYVSEDCLTLNVVRSGGSVGEGQALLPVLLWIHGGGHFMGGSADRRYNQSFIVQQAEEAGTPIIAVSINYRLASWGFLFGKAVQESGNAMLGYRDQRLALQWVQENIAAFGGDPRGVTIQGESAGGSSVGAHLLAYNGRDDGLFSQAVVQSGTGFASVSPWLTVDDWEPIMANISSGVGCEGAEDVLACLRQVPVEELNDVSNSAATSGASYGLVVDGDLLVSYGSTQLSNGDFVHVPMIVGCNTDEGTGYVSVVNSVDDFMDYITGLGYDNATAQDFAILYPDIPTLGVPTTLQGRPDTSIGLQYKRVSAFATDIRQHGPRRLVSQMLTEAGVKVFSYRFNVLVNGFSYLQGAQHFVEVAFTFFNTEGLGYPQNSNLNPMGDDGGQRENFLRVAKEMTRMWIAFVNSGDPNTGTGVEVANWPAYELDAPHNFVFEQNVTSHAEEDLYRSEGIEYVGQLVRARLGTNCTGLVDCGASDVY